MIRFCDDYSEGCHESILKALMDTAYEQTDTYGLDIYSQHASDRIRELIGSNSAVHFLVGGTQANLVMISSVLRPYQAVISAETGHIATHESGAIESSGHKVIPVPSKDGKVNADQIQQVFCSHYSDPTAEHMPQPAMLYISQPTEVGTLYSFSELKALSQVCKEFRAPLYMDGARLGCALTSSYSDISLSELPKLTDAFTIGGTKMGAMFGEALVINNLALDLDFRYMIKRSGGLLAKGRLLGIQFDVLLKDDLYFKLAKHANSMAFQLADGIRRAGYSFQYPVQSNQIFPILPVAFLDSVRDSFLWTAEHPVQDDMAGIRLCASWATRQENIDCFLSELENWES